MNDYYIYTSSDTFTLSPIRLPHEIRGDNCQIRVCEISYSKPDTSFPSVDVYCSMVVPNIENGHSSQILRRIPLRKNSLSFRFNPIFYASVLPNTIENIHIYLRSADNKLASLTGVSLNCTLHLRKNG